MNKKRNSSNLFILYFFSCMYGWFLFVIYKPLKNYFKQLILILITSTSKVSGGLTIVWMKTCNKDTLDWLCLFIDLQVLKLAKLALFLLIQHIALFFRLLVESKCRAYWPLFFSFIFSSTGSNLRNIILLTRVDDIKPSIVEQIM